MSQVQFITETTDRNKYPVDENFCGHNIFSGSCANYLFSLNLNLKEVEKNRCWRTDRESQRAELDSGVDILFTALKKKLGGVRKIREYALNDLGFEQCIGVLSKLLAISSGKSDLEEVVFSRVLDYRIGKLSKAFETFRKVFVGVGIGSDKFKEVLLKLQNLVYSSYSLSDLVKLGILIDKALKIFSDERKICDLVRLDEQREVQRESFSPGVGFGKFWKGESDRDLARRKLDTVIEGTLLSITKEFEDIFSLEKKAVSEEDSFGSGFTAVDKFLVARKTLDLKKTLGLGEGREEVYNDGNEILKKVKENFSNFSHLVRVAEMNVKRYGKDFEVQCCLVFPSYRRKVSVIVPVCRNERGEIVVEGIIDSVGNCYSFSEEDMKKVGNLDVSDRRRRKFFLPRVNIARE